MDYFRKLLETINNILASPTRNRTQELFKLLQGAKPKFATLFDVPPRSPAERAEIESGKIQLRGKSVVFNDDFKHETLFLAQELDLSERFCAHLLDYVMMHEPNLGRSATAEKAVEVFHMERQDKLACLRTVLENASPTASGTVSRSTSEMFRKYTLDLSSADYRTGKDGKENGRLAVKLLSEIDNIKGLVVKQKNALQSALGYSTYAQTGTSSAGPKFNVSTMKMRISALQRERRQLGHIIYILAISRVLTSIEISKLVRWLSTAEGAEEGLTMYILTAVLAAVDPTPDLSSTNTETNSIFADRELVVSMNSALNQVTWKDAELKAAVQLQWSIFLLIDRKRDPHLQGNAVVIEDEVSTEAKEAIRGGAFKILMKLALLSRQSEDPEGSHTVALDILTSVPQSENDEKLIESDFRTYLFNQFDTLVVAFITNMSSVLREIKRQEEDASFAAARRNISNPPRNLGIISDSPQAVRNNIECLYSLIAVIYREKEVDAGLRFWIDDGNGKLFSFLKWAADSRQPGMVVAMYDMLASLAKGPNCSAYAYNYLTFGGGQYTAASGGSTQVYASGTCSWSTLFGALEHYSNHLTPQAAGSARTISPATHRASGVPVMPMQSAAVFGLPPEEVELLRSFLLVLRTVIYYSPMARVALYENTSYRAIPSMFNLIISLIPIELKASLFETIAAFCGPGAGIVGSDIIRQTWTALERFDILPVRAGVASYGRGVLGELEQIESVGKQYPGTIAFLHLLDVLVYVPKTSTILREISQVELSTVPQNLGAGYRTSGIGPYVRFVFDDVLLKADLREYQFEAEKWKVLEGCLCFIENCLAGFDLNGLYREDFSNLAGRTSSSSKAIALLASLVTHPGSQVLSRILSDAPVRTAIIKYAAEGCEAIRQNLVKTSHAKLCILRSLRIILRLLELQNLYVEGLVPLLHQAGGIPGVPKDDLPPLSIPFLELALLQSPHSVPNIARFLTCEDEDEMALLSVQILDELSQSRYFSAPSLESQPASNLRLDTLVVCLKESERLDTILDGFIYFLRIDPSEDVLLDDEEPDLSLDRPKPPDMKQSVRSAVLRLLLRNTQVGIRAPNIAHLLLDFDVRGADVEVSVQDPKATKSRTSCLHIILETLNIGIPRLGSFEDQAPLFSWSPRLAEKYYRIVYQLCSHPFTSSSVMRYLRTREDFFTRQLAALPLKPTPRPHEADGTAVYVDASSVQISCRRLAAFLRLRSWILDTIALEIHVLTDAGQHQRSAKLLELLFGIVSVANKDSQAGYLSGDGPGQSLIRISEVFETLSVSWSDSIVPETMELQFYSGIDWNVSLQDDGNGCQIFDSRILLSLMADVRRQRQQQGALAGDGVQRSLRLETKYVLESAAVENHRREIEHSRMMSYEAWKRIFCISLSKSFDRLPPERRESILFDSLQAIPPVLATSSTSSSCAILLSEVILTLITKLREDHYHRIALRSNPEDSFATAIPPDRLYTLFKSILDCVLNHADTERARGNLYSALTSYIYLVLSSGDPSSATMRPDDYRSTSITSPRSENQPYGDDTLWGQEQRHKIEHSSLKLGTLSIINQVVERLVIIVCRDATDGSEVWKTVAFTFLDSLVRLSRMEKAHRVLSILVSHGYLQNFVQSLRETDKELQRVLKPDPSSLNALYVYEAKVALLVRIAQTRMGADKVLNARLFSILSQCEFLASRPEKDQDFADFDTFLPSAIERYHQLLLPSLQLSVSVLSTVGPTAAPVAKQALDFMYSQRETILGSLNDPSPQMTLSSLKELHVLVSLSSFVLPQVNDDQLFEVTAFKPVHSSLLSLAAKCINRQRWNVGVVVATEVEQEEAQKPVLGYGKRGNIWAEEVDEAARLLQRWLMVYLLNVTENDSEGFKPVLGSSSPHTSEGEYTSHVDAKSPSVMDAVVAFRMAVSDVGHVLERLADISAKIENFEDIGQEEIEEIALACDAPFLDELDLSQKRASVFLELAKALEREKKSLLVELHSVEVLLCLVFRHLEFYLNSDSTTRYSSVTERALRMVTSAKSHAVGVRASEAEIEMAALRERSAAELLPLLETLETFAWPTELLGPDVVTRQAFVRLLGRRIKEALAEPDGRVSNSGMY